MSDTTVKRCRAKKPSLRMLFVERMKREGRSKEWIERLRKVQLETGKQFNEASWILMRQMGYKGPVAERKLNELYLQTMHKLEVARKANRLMSESENAVYRESQGLADAEVEAAINSLPPNAPAITETNWVQAHPAMSRKDRQKDKTVPVILTVDDILCPPHGKCPSMGAAGTLQHWVNGPREFRKAMLAVQKKSAEGGGGDSKKEEAFDENLSEVESLLKQVSGDVDGRE